MLTLTPDPGEILRGRVHAQAGDDPNAATNLRFRTTYEN